MRIEIFLEGQWQQCAEIALVESTKLSRYGPITLRYAGRYAPRHMFKTGIEALSVRLPVNMQVYTFQRWPAFLIDLLPQGAAKRRLERGLETSLSEWELLERGALNPVGNLRILPPGTVDPRPHPGFELAQMLARGDEFLAYAEEVGATVAGSTDAQGEAPKFWVVQDNNGRWHPDAGQLAVEALRFALLKFPVPEAGPRATDMLRNEAAYQRVAQRLGLRVTATLPTFEGGALLVPRFDRRSSPGGLTRLGVESLYSAAGVIDSARESLRHHEVLIELSKHLNDFDAELIEYCRRDVLNLATGNRDNHGRNSAILKCVDGSMRLAPLFDFGPAYLDARHLPRVIHWDAEQASEVDWTASLLNLKDRFEDAKLPVPDFKPLAAALREFGTRMEGLPDLMASCGVDKDIIDARRQDIIRVRRSLAKVSAP
jgi:serine/threonine-protein kinase HipA